MLFPVWSIGSSNPSNKEGDATFDGKEHDAENPESEVNLSPISSALSGEQDDMTKKKDKGKSHVDYFTRNRDFNADFEDYSDDNSNDVSAAGPSNTNTSPTHGKSSLKDASQPLEMLEMEDNAYSNHEIFGAEVDFNNLETSIIEELLQFKMQKVWILVDLPHVNQSNNFTRLQALVDKKKVVVTEDAIRDVLHLDDAEGVDCLPNEEIFIVLAHMGYEKLSTKLTFYKAFFSSQRVGKGCSGVETPLFEGMLVVKEPEEQGDAEEQGYDDNAAEEPVTAVLDDDEALNTCAALTRRVEHLEHDKVAQNLEITKLKTRVKKLERANKEAVEVVTTAKLITEVIVAVSETINVVVVVPAATVTPALVKVTNTAGFRLDYFKGKSYDDICLIFEAKFNSNIEFILKTKERIEEEKNRPIASINETPAQKVAKRRRLNEEAEDVEELK
nr:hypothetical protein [Tanacetum cinerariifolium]